MARAFKLSNYLKDSFPLALILAEDHGDFPAHKHDFQELVVVLGGDCVHVAPEGSYEIRAGDVFVIAPGEQHAYKDSRDLFLATFITDLAKLELPLADLRALPGFLALFELEPRLRASHKFRSRLRLGPNELLAARRLAVAMKAELTERKPGYKSACRGAFLELLTLLSREEPLTPAKERRELWSVSEALKSLETNCAKRVPLAKMAQEARMSKRSFQRLFKEAVGDSPGARLLRARLDKAAELILSEPASTIGEIAVKTGFYDGNHLTRHFTRRFKTPPTSYRKLFAAPGKTK